MRVSVVRTCALVEPHVRGTDMFAWLLQRKRQQQRTLNGCFCCYFFACQLVAYGVTMIFPTACTYFTYLRNRDIFILAHIYESTHICIQM